MDYDYATASPGEEAFACPASFDDNGPSPFVPDFQPLLGTWFDPALDLRDPEGSALTDVALELVEAVEERQRKRRPNDLANHRQIVRHIVANSIRCLFYRRPFLVAYSRRADGYRNYNGRPAWLSGDSMSRTIDLLEKAGLLDNLLGEWGVVSSTYSLTPRLCELAYACGVTEHSLTLRLPAEGLVRLREANSRTPCLDFEPTRETRHWTEQLEAYNAFIRQQDIALALTTQEEAAWLQHWNEKRKGRDQNLPSLCRPERFKTDLYRSFNNGSWGKGGRLYGAWWINTPEHLRGKITINGQPTVELDYSGCAIRMLYHERNIDYRDDPYQLVDVAAHEQEKGLRPGHFREGIKALMQALINDCSGRKPERIPLPEGVSFRHRFKREDIRRMIEDKHAPISDAFGTGAGLHLQRRDSDLALAVITSLKEKHIAALPIHDSFITTLSKREELFKEMNDCYRTMFNNCPIIK